MVAIVDYGGGNCASVARALERLGAQVQLTARAEELARAERIVLPGVGHFGVLMSALRERGLDAVIVERARMGVPLLGICLGMQALYEGSEEAPGEAGLGLLPGRVRRLPGSAAWRVPNVGWLECEARADARLGGGATAGGCYYFTHSYYVPPDEATVLVARAAVPVAAAVERGNVFGTQFHPEKSGAAGARLLQGFMAGGGCVGQPGAAGAGGTPLRRVIACLDVRAGRVVKGVRFQDLRDCGDAATLARAHAEQGADEIFLLDITATVEARRAQAATTRRVARELAIPLGVGGGVRSVADAEALLMAGADKISVNSAAVERPVLISELAARLGSQAVVVAIDARRRGAIDARRRGAIDAQRRGAINARRQGAPEAGAAAGWEVVTHGGGRATGRDAVAWAREAAERGAGEILLTSMDRDGGQAGFDCRLTAAVAEAVTVPVIASGGGGQAEDFVEVLQRGGASAALAASIFHAGVVGPNALKRALAAAGIAVRLEGA